MNSSVNQIEVESFEQVHASARMALLRVLFRAPGEDRASTAGLVVDNYSSSHRVPPLPALPVPGPARRVAFAVPCELLNGDCDFSLEFEDGDRIELPHPVTSSTVPAPSAFEMPRVDSRAAGEEPLLAETEARAAAEAQAQELRSSLEQLRAQAEERARELETCCAQLETRLAEALAELEAVTKAERRVVREVLGLKQKLAHQAAVVDGLPSPPG